jgi:hypothetical protein
MSPARALWLFLAARDTDLRTKIRPAAKNGGKKMKKLPLVIAALSLLAAPFAGHARNDHLEPVEEHQSQAVKKYEDQLFALLHSGFSEPRARYTVVPAFTPEYSWSLEHRGGDEHVLLVHRMTKNYWYNGESAMSASRIAIGKSLYDAIARLFSEVTDRIREPDKKSHIRDGVIYYFAVAKDDGSVRIGNTHSPEDGSPMLRLTALCDALMNSSGMETVSEADWEKEIDALVHAIRGTTGAASGEPASGGQESIVQSLLRKHGDEGPQAIAPEELDSLLRNMDAASDVWP